MAWFVTAVSGGFAQGLVNFQNGSTTLISYQNPSMPAPLPLLAPVGSYYLALFAAPVGTTDPLLFEFTGAYATNLGAAGRIYGGTAAVVNNWPAGTSRAVLLRCWSSDIGHDWNPAWLFGIPGAGPDSVFGTTPICSSMTAGGFDGTQLWPSPVVMSGSGLPGFIIFTPEPNTFSIVGVGAAMLLIYRRRK